MYINQKYNLNFADATKLQGVVNTDCNKLQEDINLQNGRIIGQWSSTEIKK